MSLTQAPKASDSERMQLGLRVLPELRRELKAAAAIDGQTMEDRLHLILCKALDREDLLPGSHRASA